MHICEGDKLENLCNFHYENVIAILVPKIWKLAGLVPSEIGKSE